MHFSEITLNLLYENPLVAFIAGLQKSYDLTRFIELSYNKEQDVTEELIQKIFKQDPLLDNNIIATSSYGSIYEMFNFISNDMDEQDSSLLDLLIDSPIYFTGYLGATVLAGIGRIVQFCYNAINAIFMTMGIIAGFFPNLAFNLYNVYFGNDYYQYQHQSLDNETESKLKDLELKIKETHSYISQKLELEMQKLYELTKIRHDLIDIDRKINEITHSFEPQEANINELEKNKSWLLTLEKIITSSYEKAKLDIKIKAALISFDERFPSQDLDAKLYTAKQDYKCYIYYQSVNPHDVQNEENTEKEFPEPRFAYTL